MSSGLTGGRKETLRATNVSRELHQSVFAGRLQGRHTEHPILADLYQGAKRVTHAGDFQAAEILILECKHMEACGGSSDRCSI
jgi:hypothetical protein